MMANDLKPALDVGLDERRVAVPVEVQVHLAENRRALAEARYDLSVRRGRGWNVPREDNNESHPR